MLLRKNLAPALPGLGSWGGRRNRRSLRRTLSCGRPNADIQSSMAIAEHKDSIAALCRNLGVESLLVFGSAVHGSTAAEAAGVGFLFQFNPMPSAQYATSYFSLAAQLEALLHTPVDLVELEAVDNPYFKEAVEESRVPVYELSRS